jgi:hypothetical protein
VFDNLYVGGRIWDVEERGDFGELSNSVIETHIIVKIEWVGMHGPTCDFGWRIISFSMSYKIIYHYKIIKLSCAWNANRQGKFFSLFSVY